MMAGTPEVTLSRARFDWQAYNDWLGTGMAMLHADGRIRFRYSPDQPLVTRISSAMPQFNGGIAKYAPGLHGRLTRDSHTRMTGRVRLGGRTVTFVYDMTDRPYEFAVELMDEADLYFKCQCPLAMNREGFAMTSRLRIPYPAKALANQSKIRPAMLGRPLARSVNWRKNIRALRRWEALSELPKTLRILASFGSDQPPVSKLRSFDTGNVPDDPALTQHPNYKRGELVRWMRENLPGQIDARIARSHDSDLVGERLSKRAFAERAASAMFDVNVSGYQRSLTYRFATCFMTGTAVLSDDLAVRWYRPFEEGTEVFSLGRLGYELPQDAEWPKALNVLEAVWLDAQKLSRKARPRILERYRTVWHPAKLAEYVVNECLDLL